MRKIALIISTIGHPLITIPLLFETLLLKYGEGAIIWELSSIIGALFLVATLYIYIKYKNGSYSNFDVSVQKQRKSLYLFIVPLVVATAFLLRTTGQPIYLFKAFLIGALLMTFSFIANFFLKISLHVSLNIYLSAAVFLVDRPIGISVFVFSLMVAWSRVFLKRHTLAEVLSGFGSGVIAAAVLFWLNHGQTIA